MKTRAVRTTVGEAMRAGHPTARIAPSGATATRWVRCQGAMHPHSGCVVQDRRRAPRSPGRHSKVPFTVLGDRAPSTWSKTSPAERQAAIAVNCAGALGIWSASCLATVGQSGSAATRCRCAQDRQLDRPGSTSGPTTALATPAATARCGIRLRLSVAAKPRSGANAPTSTTTVGC